MVRCRGASRELRRVLFLIVDSGQAPQGDWAGCSKVRAAPIWSMR